MKKQNKKAKNSLGFFWPKLETKEESEKVIKDNFWFFLFMAIFIVVIYAVIFRNYIFIFQYFLVVFEALLLLFFALMVRLYKSRFFAVALFILICGEVIFTFLANLKITEGGKNIYLAIISFIVALNTVRATFRYHKFKNEKSQK